MLFRLKNPELKVRDYRSREFIPAEGIDVDPNDLFFVAMVRDGDGEWVKTEEKGEKSAPKAKG